MERTIIGYHQDDQGDWVAELACGHNQHVRHRPPFQPRSWVLTEEGRARRIETPLNCPLCDRAELPDIARAVRTSEIWNQDSMPPGLRRAHRLGPSTWGRIVVHEGRLRFSAATNPPIEVELRPGFTQTIPPQVAHQAEPSGHVRFHIEFFTTRRSTIEPSDDADAEPPNDQGGDPACWARIICPSCGGVIGDVGHRRGCPPS